jgi:predicted phosphodiesterase/sugar phosphate isomerase/epimerase
MSLIAVIADIHLPKEADTIKEMYLDKALQQIINNKPDMLLIGGDVTSLGSTSALKRFSKKISSVSCDKLTTVGNSDLRTPATKNVAIDILGTGGKKKLGDCMLIMLSKYNKEKDCQLLRELKNNKALPFIICSHFNLEELDSEICIIARDVLRSGKGIFVAGHLHENDYPENNKTHQHLIRGIDPDKASGGPPSVTYFKLTDKKWLREDKNLDWLQPEKWSYDIKHSLLNKFGFSTMGSPIEGLKYAKKELVPCLELRAGPTSAVNQVELESVLHGWRSTVPESCMSIHLNDVLFDTNDESDINYSSLQDSVELAVRLNANQVTVHLPGFEASLQNNHDFLNQLVADYTKVLQPLIRANIKINFENMHLTNDKTPNRFGCTPEEAIKWINKFKEISNYSETWLLLDIGHARNNGIYGKIFNISQWFALTGHLINGYHLHQVEMLPNGMRNHCEFNSPYGKLIPLTSFFATWHENLIRRAPVFLEIRTPGVPASFELLRNYLNNAKI